MPESIVYLLMIMIVAREVNFYFQLKNAREQSIIIPPPYPNSRVNFDKRYKMKERNLSIVKKDTSEMGKVLQFPDKQMEPS